MEGRGSIQEISRHRTSILDDDGIDGEGERENSNEIAEKEQVWGGMGEKMSSSFTCRV